MKLCDYNECGKEIQIWKMYCDEHEAMMEAKNETRQAQVSPSQRQKQSPQIPDRIPQRQGMPRPELPRFPHQQPQEEILMPELPKRVFEKVPEVPENTRLALKQTALRAAIDLMTRMEFQDKEFAELYE